MNKHLTAASLALLLLPLLGSAASPASPDGATPPTPPAAPPAASPEAAASIPQPMPPAAALAGPAAAAPFAGGPAFTPVRRAISIESGSGEVIGLDAPVASLFAADPKVAEVRPASPTSLFVFGVAPGRTTLAALDAAGRPIAQYDLTVRPSAFGASQAAQAIRRMLPGRGIQVHESLNGLVLSGDVATAAEAEQAVSLARQYLAPTQKIDNRLNVLSAVQVNLRVRVAEMSRAITRELGINWQAFGRIGRFSLNFLTDNSVAVSNPNAFGAHYFGKGADVNSIIDALAQDNLVHVLAEPNLTTMSGEPASFLVGGEFPIPIAQQTNTITIQFQQYGVSLVFVPTVLSSGRISLHVRPEVSELSNQGAVQLSASNSSVAVPALTVRRADTTVELGSGQSFAIAGLLQDSTTQTDSSVPWLGEIPVLGALFRSQSFQRNETELVIVVTPYIVHPTSDPAAVHLPTDGWTAPNDVERILLLRQQGRIAPSAPIRIPGEAGFLVQ